MERFGYPSLAAVKAESTELLYLLECESYGFKRDEKEQLEQQLEQQTAALENVGEEEGYNG